ncbi:MAG: response regulator [Bermanella sp.]
MPDDKVHILVVDDQPANLLLILRVLEEQFKVTCVESGQACLDSMEQDTPDLVLMDVRMPGMDGYECCRQIKDNFSFSQIPVIFLSAHTDITDKIKGYAAGGADYLTKPCDIQEVVAKIEHNLTLLDEFKGQLKNANDFASLAMSNSGELGVVLQFMEGSFECEDQDTLANLILATFESYQLNACVQLRGSRETINVCVGRAVAPLEISLMTEVIGGEKIMEFGRRVLCTSNNLSLIIKNLPDDDMLAGRLKDHIVSILNGATARMNNLNMAFDKEQQVIKRIKQTLEDIEKTLSNIETLADKKHKDTSEVLGQLNKDINNSFARLALTEEQENHFMDLLNKSTDELFKIAGADTELKDQFEAISSKLFGIISSQQS